MNILDTYLDDKCTYQFAEEPLTIQSEYFNIKILKAVEELGGKIDLKPVLMVSAQVLSYGQFSAFFKNNRKLNFEDRKKAIESYYSHCGFGKLSLKGISNKGGYAELISDHYADAWIKYFGQRPANHPGVGYFTCGFICGAVEALFDVPSGTFDGKQSKCMSKGDPKSRFEVFRGLKRKLNSSPSFGKQQEEDESLTDTSGVNDLKVIDAIKDLQLSGLISDTGMIDSFNAKWTKHYANYHPLIMIKLLMSAEKKLGKGGVAHIKKIFSETSEGNAYFILGNILNSSFWKENVSGLLNSDTNSLWHASLDIMTAFGHGKWELAEGSSTEYKVNIINNPETNAFLKLVGNTKAPLGFCSSGYLTGLANYIRLNSSPSTVDNDYIEKMKASKGDISCKEEQSRMIGSEKDTLMVLVH
ncbi:MAG: 4-vinyl reductase [Reichenbachiella sp.]|uniref:4-vinyl reductase n=1 Tax=Reichenbachiella sp. TaxID=2184521 RepID=UPI0032641559